jgi:hypothetical protein
MKVYGLPRPFASPRSRRRRIASDREGRALPVVRPAALVHMSRYGLALTPKKVPSSSDRF